ncbi:uncharacterized protein LOC111432437 [Cucurbita moschata]|uniref:Uncharacterized protein LOC111432437 n=1 Tax=Cucurbita moschata TaxID=3662 RepID=A0A6J1EB82_CUCMO|nr:uncharacterized protein LOC111432437 [Cucurbita moschata]
MDLQLLETASSGWLLMLRRPTFVIDLLSNGGFLKNKQITVQSSIVNPINLRFHSRAASFTTNFAAMDRFFAEATMLITCLFVSTSQICEFVATSGVGMRP